MRHKIEMLKKAYEKYCESYEFKPGNIVRWKPLMLPIGMLGSEGYKGPFVVAKVMGSEKEDPLEEPLLVVAMVNDDGRFCIFCSETFRFEPVDEEEHEDE